MKTNAYVAAILVISLCAVAFAASPRTVAADPCVATLNYPSMPTIYENTNVPVVVPMSATCTTYYGTQLYATGNAYDTTSGVSLGTVSTTLTSRDGGTTFSGQLDFTLPPSTQGHTIQFSASIYNGQYGNVITETGETVQVTTEPQQVITTTVTQTPSMYQYQMPYPSQYQVPSTYPSQQPSQSQHYFGSSQNYFERSRNGSSLLAYVAILAILAAVVIVTTGLVVYSRRQPNYMQMQPMVR